MLRVQPINPAPRQRRFSADGGLFLYRVVGDFRRAELTAAITADAAVVPGNYVV